MESITKYHKGEGVSQSVTWHFFKKRLQFFACLNHVFSKKNLVSSHSMEEGGYRKMSPNDSRVSKIGQKSVTYYLNGPQLYIPFSYFQPLKKTFITIPFNKNPKTYCIDKPETSLCSDTFEVDENDMNGVVNEVIDDSQKGVFANR